MVMQILVVYFLWWAMFSNREELFGYNQTMILTYIMLSSVIKAVVLSTTTFDIGIIINRGELSNFLIRPINFFRYYMARDFADKALNILFSIGEFIILYLVLRPPIFLQSQSGLLFLTLVSALIGLIIYFYFSIIFGLLGFWTPDTWALRFLTFVIMEFFAGGLFPLDILPQPYYLISSMTPFFYFYFFPLKVYLGQLPMNQIIAGLCAGLIWMVILFLSANYIWHKGLKIYAAEGK